MTILSLDFGLKRIGVAVGSTASGIAFLRDPLMNDDQVFSQLQQVLRDEQVEMIIVGMPYQKDGSPGTIHESLMNFLEQLKQYDLPVQTLDERYTSIIAQSKLREMNIAAKDQKDLIDSMAAQVMLQEYLDEGSI